MMPNAERVDSLKNEPEFSKHEDLEEQAPAVQTQEHSAQFTPKPTTSHLAKNTSMSSSSNSPSKTPVLPPDGTPDDSAHTCALYDANIRVQTLEQQIFMAERHIIQLHEGAGQREHGLIEHIQGLDQANARLDGNVNYLINELEKANAVNQGLNRELQPLKKRNLSVPASLLPRQQPNAAQRQAALVQQQQQQQQQQAPSTINNPQNQPVPNAPRPTLTLQTQNLPPAPASPLDDPTAMLAHTQTNLRSLRAEIRSLKTSRTTLQDRLIRLAGATRPDDVSADFLRGYDLPPHVVEKWFEVLKARDKKIAGLEALVEREREARAQMGRQRCEKCGPVVVIDGEDDTE